MQVVKGWGSCVSSEGGGAVVKVVKGGGVVVKSRERGRGNCGISEGAGQLDQTRQSLPDALCSLER